MDRLDALITQLNLLNSQILTSVDSSKAKMLKENRKLLITSIDQECKLLKPTIAKSDVKIYNDLIRKYITIQEKYRNTELSINTTQLMIKNPNLSRDEATEMIKSGHESNLCLDSLNMLNYVTERHKQVMKLEKSIDELYELFIAMNAIVEDQGNIVKRIETKTSNAKQSIKNAKKELILCKK